jgi:hypothetical protein
LGIGVLCKEGLIEMADGNARPELPPRHILTEIEAFIGGRQKLRDAQYLQVLV